MAVHECEKLLRENYSSVEFEVERKRDTGPENTDTLHTNTIRSEQKERAGGNENRSAQSGEEIGNAHVSY